MSDSNTSVQDLVENTSGEFNDSKLDDSHIEEVLLNNQIHARSRRRKLIALGIVILVIAASGFGLYKYLGSKKDSGFLTMTVGKGTVTDAIQATGTLEPVRKSQMGFKNDEAIIEINVNPGDHVKAGQILARQDATNMEAAVRQAQSQLTQDEISVQNQTLVYEAAKRTLDQQQELYTGGAVSRADLDKARDAYQKSELDLQSSNARLVNDQAKVDQARSDLDGATLIAPFDGIIGAVNAQVGQIIGLNASSNVLLTVMSEELQMSALVNEADIGRIQIGQDAEFSTSAYGDRVFKGKVITITPEAKTVSNVQYYPVVVSCEDPNRQLKSGMSVSAKIVLARKSDVLTVPMMAVSYAQSYIKSNQSNTSKTSTVQSNQGSSTRNTTTRSSNSQTTSSTSGSETGTSKNAVILVLENNQAVQKNVVLGLNDGQNYEVISGLNEREQIIVGSSSSSSQSTGSSSSSTQNRNNQRNGGIVGVPGMH